MAEAWSIRGRAWSGTSGVLPKDWGSMGARDPKGWMIYNEKLRKPMEVDDFGIYFMETWLKIWEINGIIMERSPIIDWVFQKWGE